MFVPNRFNLQEEHKALSLKIQELNEFLAKPKPEYMSEVSFAVLQTQVYFMEVVLRILDLRLDIDTEEDW